MRNELTRGSLPRVERRTCRGRVHLTRMTACARSTITRITAETTPTMPANTSTAGRALLATSETENTSQTHTIASVRERVT